MLASCCIQNRASTSLTEMRPEAPALRAGLPGAFHGLSMEFNYITFHAFLPASGWKKIIHSENKFS